MYITNDEIVAIITFAQATARALYGETTAEPFTPVELGNPDSERAVLFDDAFQSELLRIKTERAAPAAEHIAHHLADIKATLARITTARVHANA